MSATLPPPHGGTLIDRVVTGAAAQALRDRADSLPELTLDARQEADFELIAIGAVSPLTGFLGQKDYERVVTDLRLADGTVWPLPIVLDVEAERWNKIAVGQELALKDRQGRLLGTLKVSERFERDRQVEAQQVFTTLDPSHPGVADVLARPKTLIAGEITALPLHAERTFADRRQTPRELRAEFEKRGWTKIAGFQTRNPIHRAHEHLTKLALEVSDGLVIHPLVGETKADDVPAATRFEAYDQLLAGYYPKDRVILSAFPAAMRYAGPREALFHALVRKNYGINRLIVGRDHAGVGKFYGPLDAQRIFDRFTKEELGVEPLKLDPTFYCRRCQSVASSRTCPHTPGDRVELSGTKVRELLNAGAHLPREFTRPEVAEVLRKHYGAPKAEPVRKQARGTILWLTGLSGAGKSTLARALEARLKGEHPIAIVDGDEAREHLSPGQGFSKADRDTNVRRLAWVGRLVARGGALAVVAAISPYKDARAEAREKAEAEGLGFIEVHVHAELDVLAGRDVKGLYAKALRGEIQHFTGVSDPYEAPEQAALVVRSDRESRETSLDRLIEVLEAQGVLSVEREEAVA